MRDKGFYLPHQLFALCFTLLLKLWIAPTPLCRERAVLPRLPHNLQCTPCWARMSTEDEPLAIAVTWSVPTFVVFFMHAHCHFLNSPNFPAKRAQPLCCTKSALKQPIPGFYQDASCRYIPTGQKQLAFRHPVTGLVFAASLRSRSSQSKTCFTTPSFCIASVHRLQRLRPEWVYKSACK